MDKILFQEIKDNSAAFRKLNEDELRAGKLALVEAAKMVCRLSILGKRGGLIDLDNEADMLQQDVASELPCKDFLLKLIRLVLDITDADDLEEIAILNYLSTYDDCVNNLCKIIYICGVLEVQNGEKTSIIAEKMKAIIGDSDVTLYERSAF